MPQHTVVRDKWKAVFYVVGSHISKDRSRKAWRKNRSKKYNPFVRRGK